jgi:hypothetical protein
MMLKSLIVAIVGASLLVGPSLAGNRNSEMNQNIKTCRGKVAAKHVPPANKQAEMDKCLNDVQGY